MNWITALGNLFRRDRPADGWMWDNRQAAYRLFDAYYDNIVYQPLANGGQRENLNAVLGNAAAADLAGLYNPVARVADLYQHVFSGRFGVDVVLDDATTSPATRDAIRQVWQWSNMNQAKQLLCRFAAIHGNCGLRIVARNADDPAGRRVYIKPEHPRIIRDVERDERGNVIAIELEYEEATGLGESRSVVTVRELMTKEAFTMWHMSQGRKELQSYTQNDLGIVPYVLLDHSPTGDRWGTNAYYRALPQIDRLNALQTHINVQIHRHVRAKWMIAANGDAPEEIDLGDLTVAYINTRNSTSTPVMQPMVAPLNLNDAIAEAQQLIGQIEDELPELKAGAGQFLANQSGITVIQLRKPAEARLALARTNYEDAMVRAQQIALSWGVYLDLWDLGAGSGSIDAAERSYRDGYETHSFASRGLLPLDRTEQIDLDKAEVGLERARVELDQLKRQPVVPVGM